MGAGAFWRTSVRRASIFPASKRMKLFAFANAQNSTVIAGGTVRGFNKRKTRANICSGVSNKSTLSRCRESDM